MVIVGGWEGIVGGDWLVIIVGWFGRGEILGLVLVKWIGWGFRGGCDGRNGLIHIGDTLEEGREGLHRN